MANVSDRETATATMLFGRNDQWPLQGRTCSSPRVAASLRGRRVRYAPRMVDWLNHRRLLVPIRIIPRAEDSNRSNQIGI